MRSGKSSFYNPYRFPAGAARIQGSARRRNATRIESYPRQQAAGNDLPDSSAEQPDTVIPLLLE